MTERLALHRRPFGGDSARSRACEAVRDLPRAMLFSLAADCFDFPFDQLASCIRSIRTLEEETGPIIHSLISWARTPTEISRLTVGEIDALIGRSTVHEVRASQVLAIAREAVGMYVGAVR